MVGLIEARSVNLTKIASKFKNESLTESNYRRIQSFFSEFHFQQIAFAKLILSLYPQDKYTFIIDRTNWQFGKKEINFLVLAVLIDKEVAIPLLFFELDKDGCSNTEERINLIDLLMEVVKKEQIEDVRADREFIGDDWLDYLNENGIRFTIRTKANHHFGRRQCKGFGEGVHQRVDCLGKTNWLCVKKDWLIITNHFPREATERYKGRWKIENLFGFLKSRGFNLEDTHLKDSKKLCTLLHLLSLTATWCYAVGKEQHKLKPIKIRKHGRRAKSIFRLGLDFLSKVLANLASLFQSFLSCVNIFFTNLGSCT